MSESDPAGIPDFVDYEPLPSIYEAFAAGATPYAILTEIVDNSIDFIRRQALDEMQYPDTLNVEIRYVPGQKGSEKDSLDSDTITTADDVETGRLVIKDNAGGVPPDELSKFFQLGHTDAPPEGIGRFGVGAKRLIGIGNQIRYESRTHDGPGAGFKIDAGELTTDGTEASEDAYRSDVYSVDDLEEGTTRIIIEDLNKGVWDRLRGYQENDQEVKKEAEDSLWRLGETYEHFLRDGIRVNRTLETDSETINFSLQWGVGDNLQQVEPPNPVDLSHLSFDDLHPRKYKGMPFANDPETPTEECLRIDIEVGLLTSSQPENAGLTVTMNDRNVLFRDTENDLFSSRYLGKFRESAGHGRLHCIVSIRGSAEDMPWSDTKDSLDGTQEVTDEILNVAENALSEYRRQTYDNLPDWALFAYDIETLRENGYLDYEGIPKRIEIIPKEKSKVNSPRFNKKPGATSSDSYYRQYPERDHLVKTVQLHAALRIRCNEVLDEKLHPAYNQYFDHHYEGPQSKSISSDECPDSDDYIVKLDDDAEHPIPIASDIEKLATQHAGEGLRLTDETQGLDEWLLPLYSETLTNVLDEQDIEELEPIDEFDLEDWRQKNSVSEDVRIEQEYSEESVESQRDRSRSDSVALDSQSEELTSEDTAQPRKSSSRESSTDSSSSETISGQRGSVSGPDRTSDPSNGRSWRDEHQTLSGPQESTGPLFQYKGERHELSEEKVEKLFEELELRDTESPEKIFEAVLQLLERTERLEQQLRQLSEFVDIDRILDEEPAFEPGKKQEEEK